MISLEQPAHLRLRRHQDQGPDLGPDLELDFQADSQTDFKVDFRADSLSDSRLIPCLIRGSHQQLLMSDRSVHAPQHTAGHH